MKKSSRSKKTSISRKNTKTTKNTAQKKKSRIPKLKGNLNDKFANQLDNGIQFGGRDSTKSLDVDVVGFNTEQNKNMESKKSFSNKIDFEVFKDEQGSRYIGMKDFEDKGLTLNIMGYDSEPVSNVSAEVLPDGTTSISVTEEDGDLLQAIMATTSYVPPIEDDFKDVNFHGKSNNRNNKNFHGTMTIKDNIILPNSFPIPKPKLKKLKRGNGYTKESKRRYDEWKQKKRQWEKYVQKGMIPLFAGSSNQLVPLVHFAKLENVRGIGEKPSYLDDGFQSTRGNQMQTKIDLENKALIGLYSQRASGATIKNPTPTIFKTKQVRVDDDDIGHFIAAINNMYAWGDPYLPYMAVKKGGKWIMQSPDPVQVNRALVKSMLDTAGYEQGKIIKSVITEDLGKVLVYRDAKGQPMDLSLSEQQLSIMNFINNPRRIIVAHTPIGDIEFAYNNENIDIEKGVKEEVRFVSVGEGNKKLMTSDDLLMLAVRKHKIEPDTVQAIAESLYRQGWITYPRTDEEKASVDEVGIRLRKDISEFRGSIEERKILDIVDKYEKSRLKGQNYLQKGYFELKIGETIFRGDERIVFSDEVNDLNSEAVDLEVITKGVSPEVLTSYLIRQNIGTPSTRTQLLQELRQAGVISTSIENNNRVYKSDMRGYYMAVAFEYISKFPNSNTTKLGNEVRQKNNIEEILEVWNKYDPIDAEGLRNYVHERINQIKERETDLSMVNEL